MKANDYIKYIKVVTYMLMHSMQLLSIATYVIMWLYLWKPDLFTHEFWSIFQKQINFLGIAYNELKFYLEKANLSSYLPLQYGVVTCSFLVVSKMCEKVNMDMLVAT